MAENHSITDDVHSLKVSESSEPDVLSASAKTSSAEDVSSLNEPEDFSDSNAPEETAPHFSMCTEEEGGQYHSTIQKFFKLLEIYYKIFGGKMDSDENKAQFTNWQQRILFKLEGILKDYCTNKNRCKTKSVEKDEASSESHERNNECSSMLESVKRIFDDEVDSEEKEDASNQDQVTLSSFNEMLEKYCNQTHGASCENELDISETTTSDWQNDSGMRDLNYEDRESQVLDEATNWNTYTNLARVIEGKKHGMSRGNKTLSHKRKTSVKNSIKQEMASLKQIYGSKRKGKRGKNKEDTEGFEGATCNFNKTETHNLPSAKPASVKPASLKVKNIPKPKAETDRASSSGIYSKQHKRSTKIKEKSGMLSPYLDRSELKSVLAQPLTCIHYEYKGRLTANKIVEPHISYKMDQMIPDLLTLQLENWPMKLKGKNHNFDEENQRDYLETRSLFFRMRLDSLKYESPFIQSTMGSALLCYLGLTKGSLAAIKELTEYYCH